MTRAQQKGRRGKMPQRDPLNCAWRRTLHILDTPRRVHLTRSSAVRCIRASLAAYVRGRRIDGSPHIEMEGNRVANILQIGTVRRAQGTAGDRNQ